MAYDLKELEDWWRKTDSASAKRKDVDSSLLSGPLSKMKDVTVTALRKAGAPSSKGSSKKGLDPADISVTSQPCPSKKGDSAASYRPGPLSSKRKSIESSSRPDPLSSKKDSTQSSSKPGPLSKKPDASSRPGPASKKNISSTAQPETTLCISSKKRFHSVLELTGIPRQVPRLKIVSSPTPSSSWNDADAADPVVIVSSEISSPQREGGDGDRSPPPISDTEGDDVDVETTSNVESKPKKRTRPLKSSSDEEVIAPSRTRTRGGNNEDVESPRSPDRRRSSKNLRTRKPVNMADSSYVGGTGSATMSGGSASALSLWWTQRSERQSSLSSQPEDPSRVTIKPDPDAMGFEITVTKSDPDAIPHDPRRRPNTGELKVFDLPVPEWWVFDPRRPRSPYGVFGDLLDFPLPPWYQRRRIRQSKRRRAWRLLKRLRARQKQMDVAMTSVLSLSFYQNPSEG